VKRMLLITAAILVALTAAVFWLTRERQDSNVRNISGTQQQVRPAAVAPHELLPERSGTAASGGNAVARPKENPVVRVVPRAADGGERANAMVRVGSRELSFQPNALGLFPRVPIGLEETVRITVGYPDGQPGDLVVVQSEDGGRLDNGQIVTQAKLDGARQLQFSFTSTAEGGLYRVCLRKGFHEKRLEFWGSTQTAKH